MAGLLDILKSRESCNSECFEEILANFKGKISDSELKGVISELNRLVLGESIIHSYVSLADWYSTLHSYDAWTGAVDRLLGGDDIPAESRKYLAMLV